MENKLKVKVYKIFMVFNISTSQRIRYTLPHQNIWIVAKVMTLLISSYNLYKLTHVQRMIMTSKLKRKTNWEVSIAMHYVTSQTTNGARTELEKPNNLDRVLTLGSFL